MVMIAMMVTMMSPMSTLSTMMMMAMTMRTFKPAKNLHSRQQMRRHKRGRRRCLCRWKPSQASTLHLRCHLPSFWKIHILEGWVWVCGWWCWLRQRFKVQLFHPKMTIYNRSNNSDCHNALQWPLGSWWLQWSFPICIWVAAKYWWCYVANWCLLLLPLCKCQLCHSLRQWRSIRKVTENLFSVHTTGSQQSLQITRTWSRWSKPKFTF